MKLYNSSDTKYLKAKYFSWLDNNCLTLKDILFTCPTTSSSLLSLRQLSQTRSITLDKDSSYLLVKQYALNNSSDFTYVDSKIIRSNNAKNNMTIPNILPIEYTANYYITQKEFKVLERIPSILYQLEQSLHPLDFINDYKLKLDNGYDDVKFFKSALTYPCCNLGYDFEKLETLGDAVIKFIISYLLYIIEPDSNEGQLVIKRISLISNNKFYELAYEAELYKYVNINFPKVKEWVAPFSPSPSLPESTVTKKSLADVLEALIGAAVLSTNCSYNIARLMNKLNIIPTNLYEADYINTVFRKISFLDSTQSYITESDLTNNMFENMELSELIPFNKDYLNKEVGVLNHNLDILEMDIIKHKFFNRDYLLAALTNSSFNKTNNYERLEFLGDAILDFFIVMNLYNIYKHKLAESNINSCSITRAKSFLASNSLQIKIAVMLGLHAFINTNNSIKIDDYIASFDPGQKINEYQENLVNRPKNLSDVFEAIVGAIFVDAGLHICFTFLNHVYRRLIIYTAKYLDKIKYSVIDECVEKCTVIFGIKPVFVSEFKSEVFCVSVIIDSLTFTGEAANQDIAKELAATNALKYLNKEEIN
jgi:dsRNA-specific ribonuclease